MNPTLFEEALGEDDEYLRLQKMSEAIRLVAATIMKIKSFTNSQILKYMFCSYPFQQEAIKLLLNTIFDYFQDLDFLKAFERALLEVAQLKEQRVFLSSRSQSLRIGVLQQNYNALSIRNEQNKQSSIPFSKVVIENLQTAKKFAASYIKKYVDLAILLNQDVKQRISIIKDFVMNTRDHTFIVLLISIFEDLKNGPLKNQKWVDDFEEQFEIYCEQHNITIPCFEEKKNQKLENQSNSSKDSSDESSESPEVAEDNKNSSEDEKKSDIDEFDFIQNWLSSKHPQVEQQHQKIFSSIENIKYVLSFILNPNLENIEECWKHHFPFQAQTEEEDCNKIRKSKIEFYQVVRSFQTVQMLNNRSNLERIQSANQHFIQELYQQIAFAFKDQTRNFNLNHLVSVIDHTLIVFPRNSLLQILENNLLFQFSNYLYNNMMTGLLIDLHNIQIDRFGLGWDVQQHQWRYLMQADWFKWVQNLLFDQPNDNKLLEKGKNDIQIQFFKSFRELAKHENKQKSKQQIETENKQKLTEILGSLQGGKNLSTQNPSDYENWKLNTKVKEYISYNDFIGQDFDNLKGFIHQRETFYKSQTEKKIQEELSIKMQNLEQKRASKMRLSRLSYQQQLSPRLDQKNFLQNSPSNASVQSSQQSLQNSSRSIKLPSIYTNSELKQSTFSIFASQQDIQIDSKLKSFNNLGNLSPKPGKLTIASQRRLKTENEEPLGSLNSHDGFSSSRLITIYPSKQAQIRFESQKIIPQPKLSIVENCLTFFKEILSSVLDFFCQSNKTSLEELNEQIFIQQMLSMNFLNQLFELYLSNISDNNDQNEKVGEQCGLLINFIYKKCHEIDTFYILREQLKTIFLTNVDNLTRVIVSINKKMRMTLVQLNYHQLTILLSSQLYGFNLFNIHSELPSNSNIYKNLNDTVIHIFIIWFFDSNQSNCFQYFFTKFLAMLFSKAPMQALQNILFNIGLINSIYNAVQQFWINGMKSSHYKDTIYFYMRMLVFIIQKALEHRNLLMLQDYLKPLQSWKGVYHLIPDNESCFMIEIQELIRTGQTRTKKFDSKKNRLYKIKSQLTVDCFDSKLRELQGFEKEQERLQKQSQTPKIMKLKKQNTRSSFRARGSIKIGK